MARLSIDSGFHLEVEKVAQLAAAVSEMNGTWNRDHPTNTSGATTVSELAAELSRLVAQFGELAQHDIAEFGKFGMNIEVRDREDAK